MSNEAETIRAEHIWLLRLAKELVGHTQDAQDLAQETWIQALRHGREPNHRSRAWMAGVVRHLALHFFRTKRRRSHREALALEPGIELDHRQPIDALEFDSAIEGLRLAVIELREPFREAIVLRYLERLTPSQVATRQQVSINTVRSRLTRGLVQLRRKLGREEEEGVSALAWIAVWIGRSDRSGGPTPVDDAAPRVNAGTRAARWPSVVALSGAASIGFLLFGALSMIGGERHVRGDARSAPTSNTGDAFDAAALPAALPAASERATERRVAGDAPPIETELGIEVVSLAGQPVRGLSAYASKWTERGVAENGKLVAAPLASRPIGSVDARNRIALPDDAGPQLITIVDMFLVTLWAPIVSPASERNAPVVVCSQNNMWGLVVDDRNVPIDGVSLRVCYTDDLPLPRDASLGEGRLASSEATSGTDGRFLLERIPSIVGAEVEFTHPEHETLRIATRRLPSPEACRLMMLRRNPSNEGMDARIVDAEGVPVPRARIATPDALLATGMEGAFSLGLDPGETTMAWVAAPGFVPKRVEVVGGSGRSIALEQAAATLRGVLTREDGEPLVGFRIVHAEPTVMTVLDRIAFVAEPIAAGSRTGTERPTELHEAVTDSSGRFELGGLSHRPSRYWIVDDVTGVLIETQPLDPALDHRLVILDDAWIARIDGRLIDEDGDPIADVEVEVAAFGSVYDTDPPNLNLCVAGWRTPSRTDKDGRFTLENVPSRGGRIFVTLWDRGALIAPVEGDAPIELTLPRLVPYQFLVGRSDVDAVEFWDGRGEPTSVYHRVASKHSTLERVPIATDGSGEAWIPLDARSVVFFDGTEIVDRRPVTPVFGVPGLIRID